MLVLAILPQLLFIAVQVGFEMSGYSITEKNGTQLITIVREDSLTSVHDFSISLLLNALSTATHGIYSTYECGRFWHIFIH